MKNSFKFGFLALAMMVAFASCGGSQTKTEDVAEEVSTEVENTDEALENAADSTAVAATAEESLEDVQ